MREMRYGVPAKLSAAGFLLAVVASNAAAELEEVVVTAQKRAESVQDVPISVSAFDADALDAQQIDGFSDLQFSVPNVSYSKGNFSGSNFQIRGIGTLLTATSGDSGVAMHVNDVYLQSPRLFETEYYDMEQVEILRGPQGTLFGRNSTGGAINLKTAKPVLGELLYGGEAQLGNYDAARVKGSVNIPVSDTVAVRLAGIYLDRDGYTENINTGNDIDGREQYSARASLQWDVSDATVVDFMVSYFDEDSNRTRSQKQFCDQDPSGVLGCLPTPGLQRESINSNATLGNLIASNLLLGPLGVFNVFAPIADNNPDNDRKISASIDPEYEADETLAIMTIEHTVNDWLDVTAIFGYQETDVVSRMDYNGTAPLNATATIPAGFCAVVPAACTFFGTQDGGPLWVSTVPSADTSLGANGGEFALDSSGSGRDVSLQESEQWSTEVRFTTDLEGDWNFMLSFYYLDFETETDYVVQAPGLDYGNVALAAGAIGTPLVPDGTVAFPNAGLPYFNSETDQYALKSTAIFGEAYWDVTDFVKLTVGLRYSEDEKSLRDRQLPLLGLPSLTVTGIDGSNTFIAPDFTATPVTNLADLLAVAAAAGAYDGDPSTPGAQLYRDDSETFDAVTGRIVIDWSPELSFTDETLIYASYSLGYKSGGLNPPVDATLFGGTVAAFDNEEIDAFEVGTKNTLLNSTLQLNANLFYYDYGDLQIGKIVNRTSLNENTDAEIFGLEAEFIWAPNDKWLINGSVAFLDTELGDTATVDPIDPVQGRTDLTLIKDFPQASNCAVAFGNNAPVTANAALVGAIAGLGAPYLPTGTDLGPFNPALAGAALPSTPGVTDSAISSCAAIQGVLASGLFPGYEYLPSGAEVNLDGNELLNAPEMTFSIGAQYTHVLGNGMTLVGRLDYYWQDEYYTSTFNRSQDLIDSWDVYNAQVTLSSADDTWYVRVFGQNLADDDNIVGAYNTDPSSGLFTNGFFIEPRIYGATFGYHIR